MNARWGAVAELFSACMGWVAAWPFTRIIRRSSDLVVFLGRDGGLFTDNCKYLYIQASREESLKSIDFVYLVRDADTRRSLKDLGCRAEIAGGFKAIHLWLKAGTIVVDSVDWNSGWRFPASKGARVVQLWHGIPLKKIQLDRVRDRDARTSFPRRAAFNLFMRVVGRLSPVDLLLSTSEFVTRSAFRSAFKYKNASNAGYPRNDVLFPHATPVALIGTDFKARERLLRLKRQQPTLKVILYAPTFRRRLEDPFQGGTVDLRAISSFARSNGVIFLVKLHPWLDHLSVRYDLPGIEFVGSSSDAYPLLKDVDLLITDYSSIYFDFLLLDRPVAFFPYDLMSYLADDRQMYFDYASMTPGPKVRTTSELLSAISDALSGADAWKQERERVRNLVFDHTDGNSSDRLLRELFPL